MKTQKTSYFIKSCTKHGQNTDISLILIDFVPIFFIFKLFQNNVGVFPLYSLESFPYLYCLILYNFFSIQGGWGGGHQFYIINIFIAQKHQSYRILKKYLQIIRIQYLENKKIIFIHLQIRVLERTADPGGLQIRLIKYEN